MQNLTQLEKLSLLDALILAIGHSASFDAKRQYMDLVRKVKAFN